MLSVKTVGYSILAGCGLSELKFLEPLWRTVFSDLSVLASHRKKVITVEPKIYRVQLIPAIQFLEQVGYSGLQDHIRIGLALGYHIRQDSEPLPAISLTLNLKISQKP